MSAVRVRRAIQAIVGAELADLPHHAKYRSRVVSQLADGSLEAVPDDATIPGESSVPIRTGLPGVTLKVPAGTRVQIGFEGGDPSKPVAELWAEGMADEVTLEAGQSITFKATGTLDGTIELEASGQPAGEHVLTVEQLVNILIWFFDPVLGVSSALDPATLGWKVIPAAYPAPSNPLEPKLLAFLSAAAGFPPLLPSVAAALQAAIAAQLPKPPAAPVLGQVLPGIACKGVRAG